MGFIGDVLGGKGNQFKAEAPVNKFQADAAKNEFQAQQAQLQQANVQPLIDQAGQNYQDVYGQQQQSNQALRDIGAGKGPNPALAQLSQTTGQNINAATGQAASARGINPAMKARMASDTAAGMNSQASGQAATLAAQQQLGAQSQLAQNLQGQGGQATGMFGSAGQLQQGQNALNIQNLGQAQQLNQLTGSQNAGFNMQAQGLNQATAAQNAGLDLGAQQINAGVAAQNAAASTALTGGLLNAAGGAMSMSDERVKSNIQRGPGEVLPGVPEATFSFKGLPGKFRGVIAQDVEQVRPDLVAQDAFGYKRVASALAPRPMAQGGQMPASRSPIHLYMDSLYDIHKPQGMATGGWPQAIPQTQLQGSTFTPLGVNADSDQPRQMPNLGGSELRPPENFGVRQESNYRLEAPTPERTLATMQADLPREKEGKTAAFDWTKPGEAMGSALGAGKDTADAFYRASSRPVLGALLAQGGQAPTFTGEGAVPGQPQTPGRDVGSNDTVPALLTPKEIVLPLSVTQGANPGEKAKRFVEHLTRRSGKSGFDKVVKARSKKKG